MSATQRPRDPIASKTPPEADAVQELRTSEFPLNIIHVPGSPWPALDLVDDGRASFYKGDAEPGARAGVIIRGVLRGSDGVDAPTIYTFNTSQPGNQHRTITLPDSVLSAMQLGKFADGAQEEQVDADAAAVSENARPPRASPVHAEVRLTTPKQMERRDNLVALGKARRKYRSLPWWKRLVSSRP